MVPALKKKKKERKKTKTKKPYTTEKKPGELL